MLKFVFGWVAASVVAAVGGAILEAQLTLAKLPLPPGEISLADRANHTITTLINFTPVYGALVGAALLVLLGAAAVAGVWMRGVRGLLMLLGGACAPPAVALGLKFHFGVPIVVGAETPPGMLSYAILGAAAGAVAAILSAPRALRRSQPQVSRASEPA